MEGKPPQSENNGDTVIDHVDKHFVGNPDFHVNTYLDVSILPASRRRCRRKALLSSHLFNSANTAIRTNSGCAFRSSGVHAALLWSLLSLFITMLLARFLSTKRTTLSSQPQSKSSGRRSLKYASHAGICNSAGDFNRKAIACSACVDKCVVWRKQSRY